LDNFHSENTQILGSTADKLFAWPNWLTKFTNPWCTY